MNAQGESYRVAEGTGVSTGGVTSSLGERGGAEGSGVDGVAEKTEGGAGSLQVVLLEELLEEAASTKATEHWHQVDCVTADAWTHSMTEKTSGKVGMQPNIAEECLEKKEIEGLPDGMRADSVGGIDVPPSKGVSNNNPHADAKNANRENIVSVCNHQEGNFMDSNPLGPDFFPDALDQSNDVNLFPPLSIVPPIPLFHKFQ
ncbi:MAG: hypothetical protein NXY57DRAFT_970582 [Lentinula lateritia]|nr:MAG: hypothetical protein NXY57DRAFT_970582 [Lentinula lateritia]